MNVSTKIYEKRGLLSIAEALALMISFGSFIATLIFGILEAVKEDNKKYPSTLASTVIFYKSLKIATV